MSSTVACLLVEAGSRLAAIPLAVAVETLRPLAVEPLPGMPPDLLGIAVVRGATVPVVDLASLFHEPRRDAGRWVIVRDGRRTLALAVSAVIGVRAIDASALESGGALAAEIAAPSVASVTRDGTRSIAVLDVTSVLCAPDEAGGDA